MPLRGAPFHILQELPERFDRRMEKVRPGDFVSYDTTAPSGHAVIFTGWLRDEQNKIVGFKYFSSNLGGTKGVGYGQGKFSDSNGGNQNG